MWTISRNCIHLWRLPPTSSDQVLGWLLKCSFFVTEETKKRDLSLEQKAVQSEIGSSVSLAKQILNWHGWKCRKKG